MASSSARADQVKEAGLSQSRATGGSEVLPATASVTEQASTSPPPVLSAAEKFYRPRSIAEQIQQSKRHWSELSVSTSKKPGFERFRNLVARIRGGGRRYDKDRSVEIDNRKVFMELQSQSPWGYFFKTFGYTLGTPVPGKPGCTRESSGVLRVGEKFAEGAQAELFHVDVTWHGVNARLNEWNQVHGMEYAMKVFKKGTLLRHLQSQWSLGFLQLNAEENWDSPTYIGLVLSCSNLVCGTLLEDGRFAFVMRREVEDLRRCIEHNMSSGDGPFSKDQAQKIMWSIARGMDWFHSRNIVHRDLKASNVLVGNIVNRDLEASNESDFEIFIADYECSMGIVGTSFFRAPEILQACKDGSVSHKPELFTKAIDVYSYGMTCYEILTGRLPFEGHPQSDYDHVLNGHRPKLPPYVDGWICDLLRRCWDANPSKRPSFAEILSIMVANSVVVKELENRYEKRIEEWTLDIGPNLDEAHCL